MICISRRVARSSDVPIDRTSRPSKLISPDVGSRRRKIVLPVVVFPQPDSPTTPRVSPRATSNETSFTAFTAPTWRDRTPFLIGNSLRRLRTERSGGGGSPLSPRKAVVTLHQLLPSPLAAGADCFVAGARRRDDSATHEQDRRRRVADARAPAAPTNKDSVPGTDTRAASWSERERSPG